MHDWREEENKQKQTTFQKEEARTDCVQRDKGWIQVICLHDTTHLAATTTVRGNWRSRRKNEWSH